MENPMTQVLVFTTSTCPWCRRAKECLAAKGLSFREVNVERDEEAFRQMVEMTGRMAVPVLKIGETWLVGFHPPTIERALTRTGLGAVRP
jgi:glutaredoxin 3